MSPGSICEVYDADVLCQCPQGTRRPTLNPCTAVEQYMIRAVCQRLDDGLPVGRSHGALVATNIRLFMHHCLETAGTDS
eukprot:scaffold161490_cov33-Prasinocladus_malaysianus.AAC.15